MLGFSVFSALCEKSDQLVTIRAISQSTYLGDHAAGADAVVETHPALVVGVLSSHQEVLVSHVAGALVDHPAPAVHADGVTAAEVWVQVAAVAAALVRPPLEVPVLVEDDLKTERVLLELTDLAPGLFHRNAQFEMNLTR